MKAFIFDWVADIAFYTLLMVVVLHVLPEKHQRKYLEFFMGVVMIILVMSPLLKFTGLEQKLDESYALGTYDQELQEFLQRQEQIETEYQVMLEEKFYEAAREQEVLESQMQEQEIWVQEEPGQEEGNRRGTEVERIRIEIEPLDKN